MADSPGDDGLADVSPLGKAVCWPVLGPALDRARLVDAFDKGPLQAGFADDYPIPDFAYRSLKRLTHHGMCDSAVLADLNAL